MRANPGSHRTNEAKHASGSHGSVRSDALLCEIAWEVCQQSGGIYTVLCTKAPWAVEAWDERYCLIGPYDANRSHGEF